MATHVESTSKSGNRTNDELAADMDALRKGFDQLRSDVGDLVGTAAGAGKHGMNAVRSHAAGAVDDLKHRVRGLADQGAQSLHVVEDEISEYPITSAFLAFGMGFIAAKWISRR